MWTPPRFPVTRARSKKSPRLLTIPLAKRRPTDCFHLARKRTGHESRLRCRTDRRYEYYFLLPRLRKRAARDARRKSVPAPRARGPQRYDRSPRLGKRRLDGGQL